MMNQFPTDTEEWLAHEALEHSGGNTAIAIKRLTSAVQVLMLWQRLAMFDGNGPEEPRRG